MIECDKTKVETLAQILKEALEKFGLCSKMVDWIEDGGAHVRKCTNALKEVTKIAPFEFN